MTITAITYIVTITCQMLFQATHRYTYSSQQDYETGTIIPILEMKKLTCKKFAQNYIISTGARI